MDYLNIEPSKAPGGHNGAHGNTSLVFPGPGHPFFLLLAPFGLPFGSLWLPLGSLFGLFVILWHPFGSFGVVLGFRSFSSPAKAKVWRDLAKILPRFCQERA